MYLVYIVNRISTGKLQNLLDELNFDICFLFYENRTTDLLAFACRTRQLFIRILALVRWAQTTEKVTIYEVNFIDSIRFYFSFFLFSPKEIQSLLEERVQLIRHTSDTLAQLAREKLIDARVPNFPVTDAIDALTLGTVNFLPKRIAEITTIFTAATESERQEILPRLHQILTARVSSSDLPSEFTDVIISKYHFKRKNSYLIFFLSDKTRKRISHIDC